MTGTFVPAYDKTTGRKLLDEYGSPRLIPEAHLDLFPGVAATPQGAASAARALAKLEREAQREADKDDQSTPNPESDTEATGSAGAVEGD